MRGAAVAALAAAISLPAAPAAADSVSIAAPQYEAPGGTVPVVVTLRGVDRGTPVTFHLSRADCYGPQWYNPKQRTRSQTCYLQVPAGGVTPIARAVTPRKTVRGRAGRAVRAQGAATSTPSRAQIERIEDCGNPTDDVWLTFDDITTRGQLRPILKTLQTNNVRGRFFWIGGWARSNPGLVRMAVKQGHLVLNHTRTHASLNQVSRKRVLSEIAGGPHAPASAPRLLRPPFGAGSFTTRLVRLAARKNYSLCRWTSDTRDWDRPPVATMVDRVRFGDWVSPPVRKGGVLLMHSSSNTTVQALPKVIRAVRARGLTLDPLRPPVGARALPSAPAGPD